MRLFLVLTAIVVVTAPLAAQDFYRPQLDAKEIDATLESEWFGLYLQGKKIGYFQSARAKEGDTIVDSFAMNMKLVSFGQKVEMKITQRIVFENKAPYRMMQASLDQFDGAAKKITVTRVGDGFEMTDEVAGQKRTKKVATLDYTLNDALASEVWLSRGPKVGDQITYKDFELQEWRIDQSRSKVLAIKNSLVAGVEVKYYEIETESRKEMLRLTSRHDAKGNMLSGSFAIFELRAEPEQQAKNTEFSQDLFVLGMVKIDQNIGRTTQIKELVLEILHKDGEVFEGGPRQAVEKTGDGKRLLKVGKTYGQPVKATAKEIEESLQESNTHAVNHPKVQAMAKEAVGDAKTPQEKVKNIVAYVNRFVEPSLSASLPNIHDLMEKKKGDCKSFALLFTNLARAAGLPAREVSGLLYMGDDVKAFGGHAWNEVVLDGVWVPIDASLNQTEVDAGHLCFGPDAKATKNLLESMGKLSFKVVSHK